MRPVLLGLDLGTGSVKAVLLDERGDVVGRGRAGYDLVHADDGAAETPVDAWWSGVRTAVTAAAADVDSPVRVVGIGLSGQMHGTVALDAAGDPLRAAITWADRRAAPLLADIRAIADPWSRALVNPVGAGFIASTYVWLRGAEPDTIDRLTTVLLPKDWLGFRMTGVAGTEPTDASATGLWNFQSQAWHTEFATALSIDPAVLPSVHFGHAIRRPLLPAIAAELDLPAGIPVTYGRGDSAASQLGLGVDPVSGATTLTMGTGAQLSQVLPAQPIPPAPGLLALAGPYDGQHYLQAGTFSAGLALDWVRRLWTMSWEELLERGLSAAPRSVPIFAPFVSGERLVSSELDLAASWVGLRSSHDRDDLLRSAIAGTLYTVRLARDRVVGDPQARPFDACVAAGGGTRDPRLRQLIADVLDVAVLSTGAIDSSARGAAGLAAVAAEWSDNPEEAVSRLCRPVSTVVPDPVAARFHDGQFERFAEVVATVAGEARGASASEPRSRERKA